jgi:hypothetical protein
MNGVTAVRLSTGAPVLDGLGAGVIVTTSVADGAGVAVSAGVAEGDGIDGSTTVAVAVGSAAPGAPPSREHDVSTTTAPATTSAPPPARSNLMTLLDSPT